MTNTVNNMTVSSADAGLGAWVVIIARPFGQGRTLPTFHLLRS